jgi:hypothetical protein
MYVVSQILAFTTHAHRSRDVSENDDTNNGIMSVMRRSISRNFHYKGRERAAFGSALSFDKGSRWQEIGL